MNSFVSIYKQGLDFHSIPYTILDSDTLRTTILGKEITIFRSLTSLNSDFAAMISSRKQRMYPYLAKAGIEVPLSLIVSASETNIATEKFSTPQIVLKPSQGHSGHGVTIHTKEEINRVWPELRKTSPQWIVQEFFTGKEYRVNIVGKEILAVHEKQDVYLTTNSIEVLAEQIENYYNNLGYGKDLLQLSLHNVKDYVSSQGYVLSSVPQEGQKIHLSRLRNQSQGGVWRDIPVDTIPEIQKKWLLKVHEVSTLVINGLDVMMSNDITSDVPQARVVIECNAHPGFTYTTLLQPDFPGRLISAIQNYLKAI